MIEMFIMGIAIDTRTGSPIVILNDKENRKALPIWIGQAEASAIIRILENIEAPRPLTHDLMQNLLEITSTSVDKIEINDLNENTYYATIYLTHGNKEIEIDSRPSDAIILALRTQAPIFVTPNVIMDGTISTDAERDMKESEDFKNFINNLKPSDFKKLLHEDINPNDFKADDSEN